MAYKTRHRRRKSKWTVEKKVAITLLAVVVAAVLISLALSTPGILDSLTGRIGPQNRVQVPQPEAQSATAVHFVDVGQGSAVLLQQGDAYALIDAGPPENRDALVGYLRRVGVKSLSYVFLTHPHADHYGGMQAVLENFAVGRVVLPDLSLAPLPTASQFGGLLDTIERQNLPLEVAVVGGVYALGSGQIRVLGAGLATTDNYNLLSLALLFEGEGMRVLCTGDGEALNEDALISSGVSLQADVYVAAHHGSSTSNTEAFLQAVKPAIVVIQCAKNNSYGHPHREALAAFSAQQALVLRNDTDGAVVVQPDGQGGFAYATQSGLSGTARHMAA